MKTLFEKIAGMLAATALAEIEGGEAMREMPEPEKKQSFSEKLEERFVEIAYAEAADYQDIERALRAEKATETARPDECQFGDNDLCYAEA